MTTEAFAEEKEFARIAALEFNCNACGANLHFRPGTNKLYCTHCNAEQDIPASVGEIKENDFNKTVGDLHNKKTEFKITSLHCNSCGATTTLKDGKSGAFCPYCANPLVEDSATEDSMLKPDAVLPFLLTPENARSQFQLWLKTLWFAPSKIIHAADDLDKLRGIYTPYWTFNSDTRSYYTGQRGDHYWDSVYDSNTKSTKQVRRTRWTSTSGNVNVPFTNVLVIASNSLPTKYTEKLEPWDFQQIQKFQLAYLGGFITEKYQVELPAGFEVAKSKMEEGIRHEIRRDIGGDEQMISNVSSEYANTTFKYVLLPIYLSSFRFRDTIYNIVVNAQTGEVQGERPYSALKITLAVIAGLMVIVGFIIAYNMGKR